MKERLPKEVAEAIDTLRQMNKPDSHLIRVACDDARILYAADRVIHEWCLEDNLVPFVRALLNGWEVEETPVERIAVHYKRLSRLAEQEIGDHKGAFLGQMSGMLHVLAELNIQIEGVNA